MTETETIVVEPSGLTRTGAVAGIALIVLLLVGAASAMTGGWGPENWLVLLHRASVGGTPLAFDALAGVRTIDLAVLALAGAMFAGALPILGAGDRVWAGISAALPIAGIAILLATGSAGRPALTAGGLLLAWRMTKRDRFRLLGWTGVIANGLLLLADLQATGSPDPAAGDLIAAAYVLLLVWLPWLVVRMLRPLPGRPVPVGTHLVGPGGGCRAGGSDTTEMFDLPLRSPVEGALGTFTGVASDGATRFTVNGSAVTLMQFLEAFDQDVPFEVRVEERGRLAAMTIETGSASDAPVVAIDE